MAGGSIDLHNGSTDTPASGIVDCTYSLAVADGQKSAPAHLNCQHHKHCAMKTKANQTSSVRNRSRIPRKGTRKSVENRDLNFDNSTTNAQTDDKDVSEKKVNDVTLPSDRSVEDEEDRETKRKIADANPADDVLN
jgi:hypothetical protein